MTFASDSDDPIFQAGIFSSIVADIEHNKTNLFRASTSSSVLLSKRYKHKVNKIGILNSIKLNYKQK